MPRVLLPFELAEPTTVGEAAEQVDGRQAMILAGGVDLVLKMRLRKIAPEKVVSIQRVHGLKNLETNGGLRVGAMVTLHELELSPAVRQRWPLLVEALASFVSVQTKAMGTVVGNLCSGTPASDVAPVLYAYGASVKIQGAGETRELPIEEFYLDVGKTAVGPYEIATEVRVPDPPASSGWAFRKLVKTAEDIAKVNAAVSVTLRDGLCAQARIALGSVAPTPIRATQAEALLEGTDLSDGVLAEAAALAAAAACPISDIRSTADYRRHTVEVLVRDGLHKAAARAGAQGGA